MERVFRKELEANVAFLYGRVTYEMRASFWPTAKARETAPWRADVFEGLTTSPALKQTKTQSFGNGNVVVCYEPIR